MTQNNNQYLSIINRISSQRKHLDLSYQDLADLTGLSKSTLQRYETGGIKNIPLSYIEVLAKALQTTPEYILGWDTNNKQSSKEEQTLIENYRRLDDRGKNAVKATLEYELTQLQQEPTHYYDDEVIMVARGEDIKFKPGGLERMIADAKDPNKPKYNPDL